MEVPPGVQISHLRPRVCCHIVHFALVHALWGKARADGEDLRLLLLNQNTSEGVGSPFKQHVSPLDESLFHKLITALRCLPGLSTSGQEDAALLILH